MDYEEKDYNCPVNMTLKLIGGKYKPLILWHLVSSTLRFSELCKLIPQVTKKMLTQHLRELEEAGLIIRTVYPVIPPKVEYSLSALGKSVKPILNTMFDWGANYLQNNGKEINCSMSTSTKEL